MLAIRRDRGSDYEAYLATERSRVQRMLAADRPAPAKRKGSGKPKAPAGVGPTPEWKARYGEHQTSPLTESGFKMGRVYHRQPWFESLIKRDWTDADANSRAPSFTIDDLHALRRYRTAYEAAQRSETRSCLNMERGGGESLGASPTALRLRQTVLNMEAAMGPLVDTMRAIAIEDHTYADVAMARFGSRDREYFDKETGTITFRPACKSGDHPMRIKAEFVDGTKRLTAGVAVSRAQVVALAIPDSAPPELLSDQIRAAIKRRTTAGETFAAIEVAQMTLEHLHRERVLLAAAVGVELDGLPVVVRDGWGYGWVLVGAA